MHDNPCISKNHAARPVRPAASHKAIVRDVISSLNIVCLNRVLYLMYTNTSCMQSTTAAVSDPSCNRLYKPNKSENAWPIPWFGSDRSIGSHTFDVCTMLQ